jgi:hypothetical protein
MTVNKTYKNIISTEMHNYRVDFHYNKEYWMQQMGVGANNEYLIIMFKNGDDIVIDANYFMYEGATSLPRIKNDKVAYISRYYGDGCETLTRADVQLDTDRIWLIDENGEKYFTVLMSEADYKQMRAAMFNVMDDESVDVCMWCLDYAKAYALNKLANC